MKPDFRRFVVLGKVIYSGGRVTNYRGVDRATPYFVEALPQTHPANQAFLRFCDHGGESGVLSDADEAFNLVEEFAQLTPPQAFEVVAIDEKGTETPGAHCLGWDIALGGQGYSLLSNGLENSPKAPRDTSWGPLVGLISRYFRPRLNQNGLFNSHEDASFCRECMHSVQKGFGSIWESGDFDKFKVVAVYSISHPQRGHTH